MTIGTRSVLFGAHQFLLHPLFVAAAWWKLYGFPWDPRLWCAFLVHDLGHAGKLTMGDEDPSGDDHAELGARIMGRLFGPYWGMFTLTHSRYCATRDGLPVSRLCIADKLALCLEPWWLYLPRVHATGEVREYLASAIRRAEREPMTDAEKRRHRAPANSREWHAAMQSYMRRWVEAHKDGKEDTWTQVYQRRERQGV